MSVWWQQPAQPVDRGRLAQALAREAQLTKPAGSLGRLEQVAVTLASLQRRGAPSLERLWISIFAADHGIAVEGVSAYPQEVTGQMLANFAHGGAAISVLARHLGAPLELIDLGLAHEIAPLPGVRHLNIAAGTASFLHGAAMTVAECDAALQAGADAIERAMADGAELFIGGEMGIGNTSSACALSALLMNRPVVELVGVGTGLSPLALRHKTKVIAQAVAHHRPHANDAFETLRRVGGLEVAALAGAYIAAAQNGLPVLVDGYICTAAALCAVRMNAQVRSWLFYSHRGAEPGHRVLLQELDAEPLLALDLRLGEASGAALAVPLLQAACRLHNEMATFAEAAVSGSLK